MNKKYPLVTNDKVRYADTDRQGHVNNAVFSSFLETGRVEILYSKEEPVLNSGNSFVIANLNINFLSEITWPGSVKIYTGIEKIGSSSLHIDQSIYQDEKIVASAKTIIVHIDNEFKKSCPLPDLSRKTLEKWILV